MTSTGELPTDPEALWNWQKGFAAGRIEGRMEGRWQMTRVAIVLIAVMGLIWTIHVAVLFGWML